MKTNMKVGERRNVSERRGMKVSQSKTVYMCMYRIRDGDKVQIQGGKLIKVTGYQVFGLRSTVRSNEEHRREEKRRA